MININKRKVKIDILCSNCGEETDKSLDYLIRRVRESKTKFYCSRNCADKVHSKAMSGESNPNYNGKWNGPDPSKMLTTEERREKAHRQFEKYKENGELSEIINRLNEGHKRFFSTEEGKRIRRENGVKSALQSKKRTSIEVKTAEELDNRQIKYIEQYNLGNKFVLDFFLPEYNIVIECDGDYWHRLPNNVARDKSKNAYIKACGLSLYRFWESEINEDVGACIDIVMVEINEKEAI